MDGHDGVALVLGRDEAAGHDAELEARQTHEADVHQHDNRGAPHQCPNDGSIATRKALERAVEAVEEGAKDALENTLLSMLIVRLQKQGR